MASARALSAAALALLLAAPAAHAGDPSQVWRTIETAHFQIHYTEPLGDVAHKVAVSAERAHAVLTVALRHEPATQTHIVLIDDSDSSNGFASVLPRNDITLFASAAPDTSVLADHDDWLFDLVLHEYTHIVHLDTISGLPRASITNTYGLPAGLATHFSTNAARSPPVNRWPVIPTAFAASMSEGLSPMRKLSLVSTGHTRIRSRIMPGAGFLQSETFR